MSVGDFSWRTEIAAAGKELPHRTGSAGAATEFVSAVQRLGMAALRPDISAQSHSVWDRAASPGRIVGTDATTAAATLALAGFELRDNDRFLKFEPPSTAVQLGDYLPQSPREVRYEKSDLPVFGRGGASPDDPEQGAFGDCVHVAGMVGGARRFSATMNESVADLGDGTVVVRHFNVEPATEDNPVARVTDGCTYYHMPKVVAVNPKDGQVLSTIGDTSLWPACHELALALEDQLWTADEHAAAAARWQERGRSAMTEAQRAPAGLGNADERAPVGLPRIEAATPWQGATTVAKLVGRDAGVFHLPERPDAALAVIRTENSVGNVVGLGTSATAAGGSPMRPDLYGDHAYDGGPAGERVQPHNPHGRNHPSSMDGDDIAQYFRNKWTMADLPDGGFKLGITGGYIATLRREGPSYNWFTAPETE